MSKEFKGRIDVDIRDSTADWEPYLQPVARKTRRTSSTSFWTTSASRRWDRGAA